MEFDYKTVNGFMFVKVGEFYINKEPKKIIYRGNPETITVSLKFTDELFRKSDESTYLIFSEDELVYVCEYSYNLEERWLRNRIFIWHHKDEDIENELKQGKEVSLWLVLNPIINLSEKIKINISKSIEQEILKCNKPAWNKRGGYFKWAEWKNSNCLPVIDIIDQIQNGLKKNKGGQAN
ncbi:hypothetical protein [Geoalkalibacter halelectricus]|uniref:hypothetical protein n=1 Tax=Geoalkalibacter halelectricus TaxID=2847045 RepID=UPI003D1C7B7E